ncbi:hypothetical protein CIB93_27240 [Streptomyces sp. WZ.A104]|nr:hypothetical protein CIB93_27240 [Streptomyces sp. WZ.A104]
MPFAFGRHQRDRTGTGPRPKGKRTASLLDRLREELGDSAELLEAYALDRARAPDQEPVLRSLMPELAMIPIPEVGPARITAPTSVICGRHDLQLRPRVAEPRAPVTDGRCT